VSPLLLARGLCILTESFLYCRPKVENVMNLQRMGRRSGQVFRNASQHKSFLTQPLAQMRHVDRRQDGSLPPQTGLGGTLGYYSARYTTAAPPRFPTNLGFGSCSLTAFQPYVEKLCSPLRIEPTEPPRLDVPLSASFRPSRGSSCGAVGVVPRFLRLRTRRARGSVARELARTEA
jgi:hypothetical protein